MKTFARKCSVTGAGMNEGWVANDGQFYFADEKSALRWAKDNGFEDIEDAFIHDALYYTEWEDADDHEWQVINGQLVEI